MGYLFRVQQSMTTNVPPTLRECFVTLYASFMSYYCNDVMRYSSAESQYITSL